MTEAGTEMTMRARSIATSTLNGVIVVLLLAVVSVLVIIPRANGGLALTVLSGSMEPVHSPGDMVITRAVDSPAEIAVGDVLTFMPYPQNPTLITHRVTAVNADGTFTTRGDANGTDDAPIRFKQVVGEVMFGVPLLGYASDAAKSHLHWLLYPLGGAMVAYGVLQLLSRCRPGRRPQIVSELDSLFPKRSPA